MKEDQSFLSSIYDGAALPMFVIAVGDNNKLTFEGVNRTTEELLGLENSRIKGRSTEELTDLPEDIRKAFRRNYEKCLKSGRLIQYRETIPLQNKNSYWFTTLNPIKNSKGKIFRIVGTSVPVNELVASQEKLEITKAELEERVKKRTEELRESKELYELVTKATNHGIWDWNVKTNTVYFSPQWKAQVGYKPHELKDSFDTWVNLLHPDDKEQSIKTVEEYLEKPEGKLITIFRLKNKNGDYIWIHNEAASRKDKNGKVIRMFGAHTDITKQKETELALKQNEEKHRAVFESATDAYIIADENGNIVEANPSACKIYGYSYKELIEKKAAELNHPDYHHEFPKMIQALKEKKRFKGETKDLRKDGSTFSTEIYGSTINFNSKNHVLVIVRDISQQKEANLKLEEEKKFTDAVINAMPGVFYLFDKQGNFLKWNNALAELSGFTNIQVKAHSPLDFIAEHHRNKVAKAIQSAFETGSVLVEADFNSKEKSAIPFLFSGKIIKQNNRPLLVGIGIDITKRTKAEQEREKVLDDLTERMKEITCLYSINELFENKIESFSDLLQKAADLIPQGWMYPEKTSAEIQFDDILVQSTNFKKTTNHLSTLIITDKGKRGYINVYLDVSTLESDQHHFISEEKTLLDQISISMTRFIQKVEFEEALLKSESKLRNIIKYSPLPKVILSLNNEFEMLNKSFVNSIGYTLDDLKDLESFWQLAFRGKKYRERVKKQWDEVMKVAVTVERNSEPVQAKIRCKNGKQRIFNMIGNQVGDQFIIVFNDLTERIKAEEKMKRLLEDVQRSNKELEQFAYVASHDLQEPLRMVSSYTQMLERRYKGQLDEKADKYIHYAVDGAKRMQNLINDLLEFSRITTRGQNFETTDINKVVDSVLGNLSVRIKETDAKITSDQLPAVKVDPAQFERLFSNLIGNALKFRKPDQKPVIHISAKQNGNEWLFSVNDNGIGIRQDFKDKIFIIFQRLHGAKEYPGTGIGLAICKQIVNRHGGRIWFEPNDMNGTTFYFTLKKQIGYNN